jgi:WD40 repeat protein
MIAILGGKDGRLAFWRPTTDTVARLRTRTARRENALHAASSGKATVDAVAAGAGARARAAADRSPAAGRKRARAGRSAHAEDGDDVVKTEHGDQGSERAKKETEEGAEKEEEEAGDEDDDGFQSIASFCAHTSPISYIHSPLHLPHLVLTSSYDGAIRALDVNRGAWLQIFTAAAPDSSSDGSADRAGAGALDRSRRRGFFVGSEGAHSRRDSGRGFDSVSAFDLNAAGVVSDDGSPTSMGTGCHLDLIAGSYQGLMTRMDTRLATAGRANLVATWEAHERPVRSVSVIQGTHYVATASSDSYLRVWDLRKLPCSTGNEGGHAKGVKEIGCVKAQQAITAAFFSPHGRYAVATCNENKLRVWDVAQGALENARFLGVAGTAPSRSAPASRGALACPVTDPPSHCISHDNHTGRWLTPFRNCFDPCNDATIVIGGMERTLDIFDAASPKAQTVSSKPQDLLTAVPTINAVSPCPWLDAVVSGTASGRAYLWT